MSEGAAGIANAGRTHLFSGVTGAYWKSLVSPHAEQWGGFGFWAAGLKDTNGNGRAEVVVGAAFETTGAVVAAGRAYLFRH